MHATVSTGPCETAAVNTATAAPNVELIHPGVLKYFREIGVVK